MNKIFLGLFLIGIINCISVSGNKWCDIKCDDKVRPHILCDCSPDVSEKCGKVVESVLSKQDIQTILDVHNNLRQKVARGEEKRGSPGPQPKAENMPNLEWDSQLAESAQTWANQCDYGHRCADFGNELSEYVGQNIGYVWQEPAAPYENIVHNWYDEVADFNKDKAKNFEPQHQPEIGHYTQLVWANTTKVGCGGIKYLKKGENYPTTYLVCNYYPMGNFIGAPLY